MNSGSPLVFVVFAAILLVYLAASWKIFTKAGQAGWKVLIPIYNSVITLRIVGMSGWFVLLFLVPVVNFCLAVVVAYKLAKAFGYGIGMTILEFVFGIGSLIIGFGNAKYLGPEGSSPPAGPSAPTPPPNSPQPPSTPQPPMPQPPTPPQPPAAGPGQPPSPPTRPLIQ